MSGERPAPAGRPRAAPGEDLFPGEMVGEFKILERVAEGGMGTVYAATHPVIGKRAAVKVLRRALCTNQEVLERFVDEARAVNQIRHSNIVDVFAYGRLPDGRSYFVMEWLDGVTLTRALADGRLSLGERIEVLRQLSSALEAAHANGIVHRDIKPDNVILVTERQGVFVKLLDFGVAKLGAVKHASEHSSVLGTPAYIAPEQATAGEVDARTDIYSLGVIAFEIFTGRRPFDAPTPLELLTLHLHRPPPSPRSIAPQIAPALESLLLALLAKEPGKRPTLATVRRVLSQLAAAAELAEQAARAGRRALGPRPALERAYPEVAALAHPLMAELSRGVAWVEAEGAPPPGTPCLMRFTAPDYGARIDFPGVVVRGLSAGATKTLVRYDRADRAYLEGLFAVLAGAEATPGAAATPEARWVQAASDATEVTADAITRFPLQPLAGEAQATDSEEVTRRSWFGLSARVLALTVLVAIGAVLLVTLIALDRARTDRRFYVQELNTRAAQHLADLVLERSRHLGARLLLASRGGVDGAFELGDFTALVLCDDTSCDQVAGARLDRALLDQARRAQGEPVILPACAAPPCPGDQGVVLAVNGNQRSAVATVPSRVLFDERRVPQDLGFFVLGEQGTLLAARPAPGVSPRPEDHPVLAEVSAEAKARTQAREYSAGGVPMLAAWTKAGRLTVVVTAPASLSEAATQVLAREVSLVAALALLGAGVVALVFARTMTRRLRRLTTQASRVAGGDFSAAPAVPGTDEVGQLAGSFSQMTRALRERDADVLRIRDKMSDDESAALQREMSEWLETDLAATLDRIQEVVRRPVSNQDPVRDLAERRRRLEVLSAQAQASLQHALAFAAISGRRIDLAATVEDAIAYSRTSTSERGHLLVDFEAQNAVLFPRVLARESEVRDLVQVLLTRAARRLGPKDRLKVSLSQRAGALLLSVEAPRRPGVHEAFAFALHSAGGTLAGHGAQASLHGDGERLAARIRFPLDAETPVASPAEAGR